MLHALPSLEFPGKILSARWNLTQNAPSPDISQVLNHHPLPLLLIKAPLPWCVGCKMQ